MPGRRPGLGPIGLNAPVPDPVPTDGVAFRTIRRRLGLSQRKAARQLHVSRRQVQRWESGITPVPRWPAQLLWAKEHMVIPADYWCQCHPDDIGIPRAPA